VIKPKKWQNNLHDVSPYLTVGISLSGAVLFYVGVGYWVDRWLNTSPVYLLIGSGLGIVTFFIQFYRIVKQMTSAEREKKANIAKDKSNEGL